MDGKEVSFEVDNKITSNPLLCLLLRVEKCTFFDCASHKFCSTIKNGDTDMEANLSHVNDHHQMLFLVISTPRERSVWSRNHKACRSLILHLTFYDMSFTRPLYIAATSERDACHSLKPASLHSNMCLSFIFWLLQKLLPCLEVLDLSQNYLTHTDDKLQVSLLTHSLTHSLTK